MKPQTADYLDSADQTLLDARRILGIDIPRQAARLAYYAQFHAAQALIFERTNKIAKTHKGVDRQFHKLAKAEPTLPSELAGQLSAAYYYKDVADYDTGTAAPITPTEARGIATAERLVAAVRHSLTHPPALPGP